MVLSGTRGVSVSVQMAVTANLLAATDNGPPVAMLVPSRA